LTPEALIPRDLEGGSRKPRYQAIADELSQLVHSGQLPAGERLPPQRTLALSLGVTAGTVSHAYRLLEQRGLATARVGDGTYVRTPDQPTPQPPNVQKLTPVDLAHNVAIPTGEVQALTETLRGLSLEPEVLREVLSYQPETGHQRHRQAGANWLRRFGMSGDWSRVMVTHGAQHGLACLLRTIARPGDVVLTESLSYPGLLALARLMRLQLVGVEMDREGMLPHALDEAARNIGARIVFCTPSLHNPTSATMSVTRRQEMAAVIRQHHLMLIEDCVQAASLSQPLSALSSLLPENSFLISSFSKVMGPGLRVGYIEAAPHWLGKLAASMRADCWMAAPLMPEIATRWLNTGLIESLINAQRTCIAERLEPARRLLSGLQYHANNESTLVWLPLPEPWRAGQFSSALRQVGVLVRTADHFAVGRLPAPHAVRISLNAANNTKQIESGLQTIRAMLQSAHTSQMEP